MEERSLATGTLLLRKMLTLEPVTVRPEGYPLPRTKCTPCIGVESGCQAVPDASREPDRAIDAQRRARRIVAARSIGGFYATHSGASTRAAA